MSRTFNKDRGKAVPDLRFLYEIVKDGPYFFLVPLAIFASIFGGIFEALGISIFTPLLRGDSGRPTVTGVSTFDHILHNIFGPQIPTTGLLSTMVTLFFLRGVLKFAELSMRGVLQSYSGKRVRELITENLFHLSLEGFQQTNRGKFLSLFTTESLALAQAISNLVSALGASFTSLCYLTVALALDLKVTCVAISFGLFLGLAMGAISRRSGALSKKISLTTADMTSQISQTTAGFRYLLATEQTGILKNRFFCLFFDLFQQQRLQIIFSSIVQSLQQPLAVMVLAALIYISDRFLNKDLATTFAVLGLLYRTLLNSMNSLVELNLFQNNLGGVHAVYEFLNQTVSNSETPLIETPPRIKHENLLNSHWTEIGLVDVSINDGDKKILNKINLTIKRGSSVGIIGSSGSGKTTLLDVFTGLRPPSSGQLHLDGRPLTSEDQRNLRREIGYVNQDFILFNGTIFDNLTMGDSTITEEMAESALRKAGASNFVCSLKEGKLTRIGEGGTSLSGGERQRIALAREFCRTPSILILDEGTSALDLNTEKQIVNELLNLKESLTFIIISHRPEILRLCDKIYQLQNGTCTEVHDQEEQNTPAVTSQPLIKGRPSRIFLGDRNDSFITFKHDHQELSFKILDVSLSGIGFEVNSSVFKDILAKYKSFTDVRMEISGRTLLVHLEISRINGNLFGAMFRNVSPVEKDTLTEILYGTPGEEAA